MSFNTSVDYQCLQYVGYVFLGANVRAHCAFLSCSYALLLHLLEVFNDQINDDDDDDDDDEFASAFSCLYNVSQNRHH